MTSRCFFFPSFGSTASRNLLFGAILLALGASAMAQSQAPARLGGHTPKPLTDGTATLIGHYNPNQTLRLVIGLQPPHPEEEEQFLRDVQTKDSPEFHHFLTTEQWNARFAPSVQDEQAVVDWATSQGLRVTHRYPNRLLVDMEGPVSTIEKAFGVVMNSYQRGATIFFSSDREPTIPGSLSTIIHSVGGLNNWEVMQPNNK